MAGIIAKSALSKTANCFCCTLFRVRSCTAQAVFVSCGRRTRRGGGGDATGEALPQAMSRRHCRCCRQATRRSQAFVVARKRNPVSDYHKFAQKNRETGIGKRPAGGSRLARPAGGRMSSSAAARTSRTARIASASLSLAKRHCFPIPVPQFHTRHKALGTKH